MNVEEKALRHQQWLEDPGARKGLSGGTGESMDSWGCKYRRNLVSLCLWESQPPCVRALMAKENSLTGWHTVLRRSWMQRKCCEETSGLSREEQPGLTVASCDTQV